MSDKYTQREWDRTVGWGKPPYEYSKDYENYERLRAQRIEENEFYTQTSDTSSDKSD